MYSTITKRPIKSPIAGCGRISQNNFGSIEKHAEKLRLVVVYDDKPIVLNEHMARCQVQSYADFETMLNDSDCDLVVICTPPACTRNIRFLWSNMASM